MSGLFLYFLCHSTNCLYVCSAKQSVGAANSYGLHWSYFFLPRHLNVISFIKILRLPSGDTETPPK